MRIEKIELIGFKSFADKTIFNLHPGITCIVGPNGCGKSNIVDAFRWVLGEQSAKSLRGDKMEEVIFNGSAQKKPKGMSEVTLYITGMNPGVGDAGEKGGNGGQEDAQGAPAPADVMSVTRRLYRSGESEYMINKAACRLKDIKDIFLDTGLDFKSYSILEQGRIGEIINSKPLDRRFIIEEVAGVMKYKVRKAEALSKLDSSRQNLLRINDIISELKKQLNMLDRLARKAERYKKLAAEVHAIELKLARREYGQIKELLGCVLEEHGSLKEKEAQMAAEISEVENRTEARRLALLEREKELEGIQQSFQNMERDISEIERSIAVSRNDITNLNDYIERLASQEGEIAAKLSETGARIKELNATAEGISSELGSLAEVIREKVDAFREIEEELAGKEELLEEKRRALFRVSEELSGLRNELGRQQSAHESFERKEESSLREAEEARKILEGIETSITDVETGIHGKNNEALFMKEKKEVLVRELSAEKSGLDSIVRSLSESREELASLVSRLDSLKELVFDKPTRELISSGAGVNLIGSVSDVIEVEARYEKAIESALYEKADSFILDKTADIEKAVSSLRGRDAGRTSFITLSPPRISLAGGIPEGIIGAALEFVKVRQGYERIAENLLSGILLVKDLNGAFELLDGIHTFVTIDGEVVEASGAVVAGEGKGVFKRKRQIRELDETIEDRRGRIEKETKAMQTLQESILQREEAIRTVETSLHAIEKEISLARLTVENYSEEKERTNRKLAYLSIEREETLREKESLRNAMAEMEGRISAADARKNEVEADTLSLQEEIGRKRLEIEEQRTEVTELRLDATSKKEKGDAVRNELESSEKAVGDLQRKKSEIESERESVRAKLASRESEITGAEERLKELVKNADTLRLDISQRKDEIEKENGDLIAVEQGLRVLRQEVASITSRLSELDIQRTECKMRGESLSINVRTNYGMEIEEVDPGEISPEEEARLSELKEKIQEMGPVNLGTLEEYEELSARYEFLTKQHEDLTKSIAELEEAISKINTTTRKKLREAFEVLNEKFKEIFVTLFGGGRAELVLTDEQNILETGIDIIAQPPGKKLQNIHLLSGGEKALTALSIQFASFLIKPTPLCILDEADAPLDESNTERYSKMLAELSKDTQFIVVTHNRTTMSVAQHLYGITMEEAGVSKVISMQLAEAEAAA